MKTVIFPSIPGLKARKSEDSYKHSDTVESDKTENQEANWYNRIRLILQFLLPAAV
jgi:hypothetical protein